VVDAAALGMIRDGRAGWRKARERPAACRRPMLKRTAKTCGPDASAVGVKSAEVLQAQPGFDKTIFAGDGDNKARFSGESAL
jgi:hypothetical protein